MSERGLYIHIPFCSSICTYCDFSKFFYDEKKVDEYLDCLQKELDSYSIDNVQSIYIGGGTPTSLNNIQLERLLKMVEKYNKNYVSYTIEANVLHLDEEKIKLLSKYHISRVSLGIQSFNSKIQNTINRHHTYDQVKKVIELLNKYGINDVNGDLIYGFNEQSEEDLLDDLKLFTSLPLTHISTYALMINEHTILGNSNYQEVDQAIYRKYYDLIVSYLEKFGFKRYEVSNFAKDNYQSKHNLLYWNNKEYYGIGVGASGYINNARYDNTKSLNQYQKGKIRINEENLSDNDREFYHIMLGLRLERGIDIDEFNKLYKTNLLDKYSDKLKPLISDNLIEVEKGYLKITKDNFYIMDFILRRLLF